MLGTVDNPIILVVILLLGVYSLVITVYLLRLLSAERPRHWKPTAKSPSQPGNDTDIEQQILLKADEAQRLINTFQKFVPRQFVDHLTKQGSKNLELGRADEDDVAILFCDIRGFTGLSETMTPQELMNFLNSYFLRMNDPIHRNHGFIDKFIGDAIMALFDHPGGSGKQKTRDALQAAIDLRKAVNIYNVHRHNSGYDAINVGIGIHFGPAIFGTVGSDDRMDTTVIGDSVNIAYRLESLAPKYHADIVVSAQVIETAAADELYSYRLLDWVRVKGRQQPIVIYEILDHLSATEQEQRLATCEQIKLGLHHRIAGDWEQARKCFEQALAVSPDDPLIQHHLRLCDSKQDYQQDSWDGAVSA